MKKGDNMKKAIYMLVTITFFFIGNLNIKADFLTPKLSELDIKIKINDDGSADVSEIWNMQTSFRGEVCKQFTNVYYTKIIDFKVTDEVGDTYTILEREKVYRDYSIDEFKLCWITSGLKNEKNDIENSVSSKYLISYKIKHFVIGLKDSQLVSWNIVSKQSDLSIKNITITISYDKEIENKIKSWKYGFTGNIESSNNKIHLKAEKLNENDYIKVLIKLKKDTFKIRYWEPRLFRIWHMKAKIEALTSKYPLKIVELIFLISTVGIIGIITYILSHIPNKNNLILDIKVGKKGKKINSKKVEYFRDIPCNGDIYRAYFIINLYNLNPSNNYLIGAIILKWINENKVELVDVPSKMLGKKNKAIYLKQGEQKRFDNEYEIKLYKILLDASRNGLLEKNELFSVPKGWYEKIIAKEKAYLLRDGGLTRRKKFSFLRKYQAQSSLRQEAIHLVGLKKFLLDFSIIDNKEAIEIHLWEQYLIFAQLLGIADKVDSEFKKLYPNSDEDKDFLFYLYDMLDL